MTKTEHIASLLKEYCIELKTREWVLKNVFTACLLQTWLWVQRAVKGDWRCAYSNMELNYVFFNEADLEQDEAYHVALHEIGHCVTKNDAPQWHSFLKDKHANPKHDEVVKTEELAWDWAIKNSKYLTPVALKLRDYCLESYRE